MTKKASNDNDRKMTCENCVHATVNYDKLKRYYVCHSNICRGKRAFGEEQGDSKSTPSSK